MIQETIVPKEPPPEFEFIADPPSISAFDLDVVKLTAQFVARNGRQFLTQLMQKEQRNYQFDFLRPQHSLFNYFTKLVEQYTKVPGRGPGGEHAVASDGSPPSLDLNGLGQPFKSPDPRVITVSSLSEPWVNFP